MAALRRCAVPILLTTLLLAGICGCGGSSRNGESALRDEVNSSLKTLEDSSPYRYRIHLENWIGVSGQSVYGDEKGEGSFLGGDFFASILRTSPAGEETLAFTAQNGVFYLQELGSWRTIDPQEAPSPLYNPEFFVGLASAYGSISLEGEEERSGVLCRRYLLQLGEDKAREALSEHAWSYFSSLAYELNCRVWVSDASAPPLSLRLEVVGFDPEERLQRYRIVAALDLYDFGSAEIELIEPGG